MFKETVEFHGTALEGDHDAPDVDDDVKPDQSTTDQSGQSRDKAKSGQTDKDKETEQKQARKKKIVTDVRDVLKKIIAASEKNQSFKIAETDEEFQELWKDVPDGFTLDLTHERGGKFRIFKNKDQGTIEIIQKKADGTVTKLELKSNGDLFKSELKPKSELAGDDKAKSDYDAAYKDMTSKGSMGGRNHSSLGNNYSSGKVDKYSETALNPVVDFVRDSGNALEHGVSGILSIIGIKSH